MVRALHLVLLLVEYSGAIWGGGGNGGVVTFELYSLTSFRTYLLYVAWLVSDMSIMVLYASEHTASEFSSRYLRLIRNSLFV